MHIERLNDCTYLLTLEEYAISHPCATKEKMKNINSYILRWTLSSAIVAQGCVCVCVCVCETYVCELTLARDSQCVYTNPISLQWEWEVLLETWLLLGQDKDVIHERAHMHTQKLQYENSQTHCTT